MYRTRYITGASVMTVRVDEQAM